MKLTLFHRSTNAPYDHACGVAGVPVLDTNDQPAGYIGAAWGEYPDAPDCLDVAVLEPDSATIDLTLSFWGLHRDPNPPIVPDDESVVEVPT